MAWVLCMPDQEAGIPNTIKSGIYEKNINTIQNISNMQHMQNITYLTNMHNMPNMTNMPNMDTPPFDMT